MISQAYDADEPVGRLIEVTPDAMIFADKDEDMVFVRKVRLDSSDFNVSCYSQANDPASYNFYKTILDSI
jgi:hypothetical protein